MEGNSIWCYVLAGIVQELNRETYKSSIFCEQDSDTRVHLAHCQGDEHRVCICRLNWLYTGSWSWSSDVTTIDLGTFRSERDK